MGKIFKEGKNVNLMAGDDYDDHMNQSYYIEDKDGNRVSKLFFSGDGYEKVLRLFQTMEAN